MKLNCLVIEDSAFQRMIVVKLVNNNPQLHLVGEFSNAIEARNCMKIHDVDLIFLDIEMPIINGFSFLEGLKKKLQIIFVTAKAEYALRAFDYSPTDYIKKPVTLNRFEIAVNRALYLHQLEHNIKEETGEHIYIKSNLKKLKIFTAKIKWIEAFGDYVKVVTEDSNHLVLSTMKSFEANLNQDKFIRVHKSYIINIDKIERYNSKFIEIKTSKIPLSRNKKEDLIKILKAD